MIILAHPNEIKHILSNNILLTQKIIKIILTNSGLKDINFYECCLRLLKSLAKQNLFAIEKIFSMGFINKIDEYLFNDICYQYISSKF